jgi:hypothetical protein
MRRVAAWHDEIEKWTYGFKTLNKYKMAAFASYMCLGEHNSAVLLNKLFLSVTRAFTSFLSEKVPSF